VATIKLDPTQATKRPNLERLAFHAHAQIHASRAQIVVDVPRE
jgi:hypothetical protein